MRYGAFPSWGYYSDFPETNNAGTPFIAKNQVYGEVEDGLRRRYGHGAQEESRITTNKKMGETKIVTQKGLFGESPYLDRWQSRAPELHKDLFSYC